MHQQQFKRRLFKYLAIVKPTIIVGIFFICLYLLIKTISPYYNFARENNISPKLIISLILNQEVQLKNYQGRTNIVLLGLAGGNYDGADLTDTMIFASVDLQKKDLAIVSIPRDIWLPSIKDKINSAYHYGEEKKPTGGIIMAKAAAEEIIGQPVHFGITVDFAGFRKIIDMVGGIDVEVERSFTDKLYPIEGREDDFCGGDPTFACRYETVRFEKGKEHMDGERALKYVRSRYAEGEEGTDFARSKRQQQVMVALKNKVMNYKLLKDFELIKQILIAVNGITKSDMNWSEKAILAKFFLTLKNDQIRKIVLDSGDEQKARKGFLENPPEYEYKGKWVLVPRTGNFEEIQKYISCQLDNPGCPMKP